MWVTVEPSGAPGEVWQYRHRKDLSVTAVWSEKRPGLGEDAEPTFLHHVPSGRGLLGVYDGLGGAGARQAGAAEDGRHLTHAFVASRLAKLTVQAWFAEQVRFEDTPAESAHRLREQLSDVLVTARPPGRRKLGGTLRRDFPTTMALLEYRRARASVDITAYWAGDSRCYLLTAGDGLQQLSRDDSDVHDPLELLIADQPMTNLISASGDFTVNHRRISNVTSPCMLICATDGFFGYVASPAIFEYELLNELRLARDEAEWGPRLARRVTDYTGDDASIAIAAVGFGSYAKMRGDFERRFRYLHDHHFVPLQNVQSRDAFVQARQHSWELYRTQYMHHLESDAYGRGWPSSAVAGH